MLPDAFPCSYCGTDTSQRPNLREPRAALVAGGHASGTDRRVPAMPERSLYGALRGRRGGHGPGARTGMRCSGRPSWRRLRHTTIWRPTTFMCGAGNGTKPIRVRLWRRAGHGPGSSLSGAARACFRMRTVTVCSACSRVFPHGVTRRRGFRRRRAFWTTWGRRPQPARNFHKQSARRSRKETVCANVQKHRIP